VVDKIPKSTDVIFNLFGEGKCLSYEARNPLSQGAIKPLNVASFSCFLTDGPMSIRWNEGFIGFPEIGITDRTLSVHRWQ
jgi:hypothetical protein